MERIAKASKRYEAQDVTESMRANGVVDGAQNNGPSAEHGSSSGTGAQTLPDRFDLNELPPEAYEEEETDQPPVKRSPKVRPEWLPQDWHWYATPRKSGQLVGYEDEKFKSPGGTPYRSKKKVFKRLGLVMKRR